MEEYSIVVERIARNPKLSINQVVAIRSLAHHGNKTRACQDAGVGYMTLWRWWNHSEDFREAIIALKTALIEQEREALLRDLEQWFEGSG